MKLSQVKKLLPYAMELCDTFEKYHHNVQNKGNISVNDIFHCSAKYYGFRILAPSLNCESLNNLQKGAAIKRNLIPIYNEFKGYSKDNEYYGSIEGILAYEGLTTVDTFDIDIIAKPDLVKIESDNITEILNIKFHQQEKGAMIAIMASQHHFLRALSNYRNLYAEIPHLANYKDDLEKAKWGGYYPAYINDLIHLIVDDQFTSWKKCSELTKWGLEKYNPKGDVDVCDIKPRELHLKQILRDGPFDINIDRNKIKNLWNWFWKMMENTIFGWRVSLNAPSDFNKDVFNSLVAREIVENKCIKYYQCRLCPFFNKMCCGMPPLRSHVMKNDDFYYMSKFIKFWNNELVKHSYPRQIPPSPIPTIKHSWTDNKGVVHKANNKADWKECVAWTKKVITALNQYDLRLPLKLSSLKLKGKLKQEEIFQPSFLTPRPPSPPPLQTTSLPSYNITEPKNIIKPPSIRQDLGSEIRTIFKDTGGKPSEIIKKAQPAHYTTKKEKENEQKESKIESKN